MNSWWVASNPSQSPKWTQNTTPKTNLELMGPIHVGFGLQNHQYQCSIQVDSMNRLDRMPTGRAVEKFFENLTECFLKNKESNKKKTESDSEFRGVRYDQNKLECSEFELAPIMNFN